MKWSSEAPSNIALIKYMGKHSYQTNLPSNASLSYTLPSLRSFVEIEQADLAEDVWQALPGDFDKLSLSDAAQKRFLQHFKLIKNYFNFSGNFYVRSANNFPNSCGLASSASSFAALTLCATQALSELTQREIAFAEVAKLSRQGSGSSCRSLSGPWVKWQDEHVETIALPYSDLKHVVVVVDANEKAVSSSEAHRRVTSSLLFNGRTERANQRLDLLLSALQQQRWQDAFQITWQEFWDMHCLFETSSPSFGYFSSHSLRVLDYLRQIWHNEQDGPLVTMDAGPNIHLLFRADQTELQQRILLQLSHYSKILAS